MLVDKNKHEHILYILYSNSTVALDRKQYSPEVVSFHPAPFTRPSFSIFRGSGSETSYSQTCYYSKLTTPLVSYLRSIKKHTNKFTHSFLPLLSSVKSQRCNRSALLPLKDIGAVLNVFSTKSRYPFFLGCIFFVKES